jgi:sensor c-di-GMP phosphodiesterase-like protein
MRRIAVLIATLVVAGLGGLWYRHQQAATQERDHLARIGALVNQRSSQSAVEAELGAPIQRRKGGECAEEWTYRMATDRRAVLCFDEKQRAAGLRIVRSFDRQDY